jgi:hypothetical protein
MSDDQPLSSIMYAEAGMRANQLGAVEAFQEAAAGVSPNEARAIFERYSAAETAKHRVPLLELDASNHLVVTKEFKELVTSNTAKSLVLAEEAMYHDVPDAPERLQQIIHNTGVADPRAVYKQYRDEEIGASENEPLLELSKDGTTLNISPLAFNSLKQTNELIDVMRAERDLGLGDSDAEKRLQAAVQAIGKDDAKTVFQRYLANEQLIGRKPLLKMGQDGTISINPALNDLLHTRLDREGSNGMYGSTQEDPSAYSVDGSGNARYLNIIDPFGSVQHWKLDSKDMATARDVRFPDGSKMRFTYYDPSQGISGAPVGNGDNFYHFKTREDSLPDGSVARIQIDAKTKLQTVADVNYSNGTTDHIQYGNKPGYYTSRHIKYPDGTTLSINSDFNGLQAIELKLPGGAVKHFDSSKIDAESWETIKESVRNSYLVKLNAFSLSHLNHLRTVLTEKGSSQK